MSSKNTAQEMMDLIRAAFKVNYELAFQYRGCDYFIMKSDEWGGGGSFGEKIDRACIFQVSQVPLEFTGSDWQASKDGDNDWIHDMNWEDRLFHGFENSQMQAHKIYIRSDGAVFLDHRLKKMLGAAGPNSIALPLWCAAREAAENGKIDVVLQALSDGMPVDYVFPGDGDTLLIKACYGGHAALVRALLDSGADPRHRSTPGGEPPLFYGAAHASVLRILLETDAKHDIDYACKSVAGGFYPIHRAAKVWDGSFNMSRCRMAGGICLDEGLRVDRIECIRLLIEAGANINRGKLSAPNLGQAAAHYVFMTGDAEYIKAFMKFNPDLSISGPSELYSPRGDFLTPVDCLDHIKLQPKERVNELKSMVLAAMTPCGGEEPMTA